MTQKHARPHRLAFIALALAGLCLSRPEWAMAEPSGLALVISVDPNANVAKGGVCGSIALAVRDRMSEQGLAVQTVLNPSAVAMRSAIDGFAMQIEAGPPGIALVYVCGAAVATADRLFLIPSDARPDGHVDPNRQGVVLQALLNALAGSGGTLYADLRLAAPAATGAVVDELGRRLPAGLHLALSLLDRDGAAPIGTRLASAELRAEQDWAAAGAMMQAGPGALDRTAQTLLLPMPAPVNAVPAPVSPPQDASRGVPAEPDTATPLAAALTPVAEPPGAAGPPLTKESEHAQSPYAQSPPGLPLRPPARVRSVDTFKGAGVRGEPPDSDRIKRLQTALARSGYGGPVDGRLKEPTMSAIRAFQRKLGNPETGVLTQAELVHLLNH